MRIAAPLVSLILAACATGPATPDLRAELRANHGYEGRLDDAASIGYLEARPELRAALGSPEVAELSRVLAADYGLPFDPADAPELISWARDEAIRTRLLDDGTRAFARPLAAAGVVGTWTFRLYGGPLWSWAPRMLGEISARKGMGRLCLDLGRDLGYRLLPVDASALGAILDDPVLRDHLRRIEIRSGWSRIARAGGDIPFRPGAARAVVALAGEPDVPGVVRRLREDGVRIEADGLEALVFLVQEDRLSDLVVPRHRALLRELRSGPGAPLDLREMKGTLVLAEIGEARAVLRTVKRLGGRVRLEEPAEIEAVLRVCRDPALLDRIRTLEVPVDAGRDASLRSLSRLVDALASDGDLLDAWLNAPDRAFRARLGDDGTPRAEIEQAILASRGSREVVSRPSVPYVETGVALPVMNRVDLLRIRLIQHALEEPETIRFLSGQARADRADRAVERGGWIDLDPAGRAVFRADSTPSDRGPAGDRRRTPSGRPRADLVANWHVHAVGGRGVAGPSAGRFGDLASARRTGIDGVVVTDLGEDGLDLDFHDTAGRVFDLGVFFTPAPTGSYRVYR